MTRPSNRGGRPRGRPAGCVPMSEDRERHEVVILAVILEIAVHLRKHPTALGVFALLDFRSDVKLPVEAGMPIEIRSHRPASYARSRQKYLVRKADRACCWLASGVGCGARWFRESSHAVLAYLRDGAADHLLRSDEWRSLLPLLDMVRVALASESEKIFHVAFYLEQRRSANGCSLRLKDERGRSMRMAISLDELPWMASLSRDVIDNAIRTGALVAREAGGHQVVLTSDLQSFMEGLPPVPANAKPKKDRT